MERKVFVWFYQPEAFHGYLDLPDDWDDMDYDAQREWVTTFFQDNGLREIEVDEVDAD